VTSDAASDQFVFEKGHDTVADVKPDMIETDHAVADIRHCCKPRATRTRWARSTRTTQLGPSGGNLTGINFFVGELAAKRLEVLRELVPGGTRVALLLDPSAGQITETTLRDVEAAARPQGAANPGPKCPN
jgi:hypothetical protein